MQHELVSWKGAWVFLGDQGALAAASSTVIRLVVVNRVPVPSHPHAWGNWFGWFWLPPHVSKSCLQIPDYSTSEIQLLLPPGSVSVVLLSRFLNSVEIGESCTAALTCLTNFINDSEKTCWRPRDPLLPSWGVDWGPRYSFGLAWGMGSLRQRMIGLRSQGGLAARLAPPNSARGGKEPLAIFKVWCF